MRRLTASSFLLLALAACSSPPKAAPEAPAPASAQAPPVQAPPPAAQGVQLPTVPDAAPRERYIAIAVRELLQNEHLQARPMDASISGRAMEQYVLYLDRGKLYLLEPQVQALKGYAGRLGDELERGDLHTARLGGALLAQQQRKVGAMIADLLSRPFDFSLTEELQTDGEKRAFVKDDGALKDRWRRLLKLQVLERVRRMERAAEARAKADKDPKASADKEALPPLPKEPLPTTESGRREKARKELADTYAGRFSRLAAQAPLDAVETYVNALTAIFDPHTLYLAPDDKANFDIQMSGSLEGIGAVLTEDDHYIKVREVVPGGAAWRQGDLDAGDLIMQVQQAQERSVDIADMRLNEVVKLIRGPKGTLVTLTVRKADDQVVPVQITRDVIVVEATYARGALLDLGKGYDPVGYVYLPSFYGDTRGGRGPSDRNATADVKAMLQRFSKQKVGSVLLDLRSNGGGLLSAAKDITGLFIEKGPVVQVRDSRDRIAVLADEDPGIYYHGDVVVLVDRFSASAAEILAGALQDYGRALVVGTGQTHGKGTVQTLADLSRIVRYQGAPLGVLKLTIQQYFLVDGRSTQLEGVKPDVILPDPAAFIESGERYLDNAIPFSAVTPLPHTPWSKSSWDVAKLSEASQKRQAQREVFSRIQARSQHLQKRREDTVVPLAAEAFQAKRKADEDALDQLDPKLDEQPTGIEVKSLNYRPATKQPANSARVDTKTRMEKWREGLARDPWITESLHIIHDMATP